MRRSRRLFRTARLGRVALRSISSLLLVFLMFILLWLYSWGFTPHIAKDSTDVLPLQMKKGMKLNASLGLGPDDDTLKCKAEDWMLANGVTTSIVSEEVALRTVEESSLLHVYYTGKNKSLALNDIMKRLGYEKGVTSSICPPLPENVTISLEEGVKIGMIREFLGGMYHPEHCKWLERYNDLPNKKESDRDTDYMSTIDKKLQNCREKAERAKDELVHHTPKYAYVMMVSNHRYLDGAMVSADSIRQHSLFARNGSAEIVLMINEHIKENMFPLLQVTFDRVMIFHGLQIWATKSAFQATFDKMYIFTLTDYTGGIVFVDADSLITDNPDLLLQLPEKVDVALHSTHPNGEKLKLLHAASYPLSESQWKKIMQRKELPQLFAVGTGDYFKTNFIILRPSMKVFLDLYLEFRYGGYGYNRRRASDGVLFRTCFKSIGRLSSRPSAVHHYSGTPKPWFNLEHLDHTLEPRAVSRKTQIPPSWRDHVYEYEWWTRYELLHRESFYSIEMETRRVVGSLQDATFRFLEKASGKRNNVLREAHITKYGGATLLRRPSKTLPLPLGLHSREEVVKASPKDYMWMMRFERNVEYLRPTRAYIAKLRTLTFPIASADDLHSLLSLSNSCKLNSSHSIPTTNGYCPTTDTVNSGKKSIVYAFALRKHSAIKRTTATNPSVGAAPSEEEVKVEPGAWTDCDKVCRLFKLQCDEMALLDTRIADCQYGEMVGTMGNGLIRCKRCLPHFTDGAPFLVFQDEEDGMNSSFARHADVCFFNAWTRFALPRCNASKPSISLYELRNEDVLSPLCACR